MYLAFKGEVWDGYIYLGAMHLETFVEVGSHSTVLECRGCSDAGIRPGDFICSMYTVAMELLPSPSGRFLELRSWMRSLV